VTLLECAYFIHHSLSFLHSQPNCNFRVVNNSAPWWLHNVPVSHLDGAILRLSMHVLALEEFKCCGARQISLCESMIRLWIWQMSALETFQALPVFGMMRIVYDLRSSHLCKLFKISNVLDPTTCLVVAKRHQQYGLFLLTRDEQCIISW
jgi:hypothetical protein